MKRSGLIIAGLLLIIAGVFFATMEGADITQKIGGASIAVAGAAFIFESAKKKKS